MRIFAALTHISLYQYLMGVLLVGSYVMYGDTNCTVKSSYMRYLSLVNWKSATGYETSA